MSKQIDERVVEMTFDNADFEKNVKQSMSTIDKLKQALNFKGAANGLNNINTAAKQVNLNGISSAVESLRVKFNALQIAGTTALVNITNTAINTGKNMASAFTIQPITDGFAEYETQLNSVQTIMANTASKGTTIEQVTDALNELNTYADKTIYNFSEMTRNIGTFTAAGVDLDKSVASIKGIANLAAMSGSSATQASTAMYQLSQAIAAGKVSLMDWNSVVNAGMGGEQFQEALKRTARVMGTGVDAAIEKYGSFRESLTQGQWLTTDVLTETLKQISGAYSEAELMQQGYSEEQAKAITQMASTAEEAATKVKAFTQLMDTMKEALGSGWATTWQTIFGDFYEARDFWTSISDWMGRIIGDTADARNALFKGAFTDGWDLLRDKIEQTGHSFDDFQNTVIATGNNAGIPMQDLIDKAGGLGEAFQNGSISIDVARSALDVFATSAENNNQVSKSLEQTFSNFTNTVKSIWTDGKFDEVPEKLNELSRAGYNFADAGDLVKKIANGEEVAFSDLTEEQLRSIGATEDQLTSLRDLKDGLTESGSEINHIIDILGKPSGRELFFSTIKNSIDAVLKPIQAFKKAFNDIFSIDSSDVYGLLEALNHFTESLIISDTEAKNLQRTFRGLFAIISILTSTVGGVLKSAFTVIQTVLDDLDIGFLDATANIGDAAVAFADFVNSANPVTAAAKALAHGISSAIKPISEFVKSAEGSAVITGVINNIHDAFFGLLENVKQFGSGAFDILKDFIKTLITMDDFSLENIIKSFADFGTTLRDYFAQNFTGIFDPIGKAASGIASVVNENFSGVIDVLIKLKDVAFDVVDALISKFSGTGLAGIFAIVFGAGILNIIGKFLKAITSLRTPIDALTGLFDGLTASFAKFAKAKSFQAMSVGIRNIAISIAILAASVVALAQVPVDQLVPAAGAIVAIGVALAGVTAALGYFARGDASIKLGGSIAAIGAGILMIASSFAILDGIDTDSLTKSGTAIVAIMVALGGLSIAIQKFGTKGSAKEFGGPALQIIALAAAVRIVADAIKTMADIDQASMVSAIFGMITVFGALTGLIAIMNKFSGGLGNASGLLVMTIGLQAFIMVVQNLANFDASGIIANLPNIIVLFGMITALMAASSLAGKNSAKGGAALILISGAMLIMTQVIKTLGGMDESVLSKGVSAITTIGIIFALLISVTNLAGDNAVKAGASMLIMSTAIIVLSGAIALLGSMDESTLKKGLAVVAAISAIFAGLIAVTHFAEDASKTIIKMTVAIGALVAMVILLSVLDPEKVVPATACITALMVAFGAMTALTKFSGKASSGMVAALGIIVVLSGIVALLGGLPMDGAIQAAIAIGILVTAMSVAVVAMGKIGPVSQTAMDAMVVMTGVVAALAVVMGLLTALDVAPSIDTAIALSIMLGTMTGVLAVLSLVKTNLASGAAAAAGLAAFIVILGGVFAAIGALNNYLNNGISDAIANAIPVLQNIGTAIGSFIEGIVGGLASGAMSALPSVGQSISSFWMNIQPFVLGMQVLGPDALNGVKTLVEMMTMITASNMLEGLAQFFGAGNSMDNFAVNLVKFGSAISTFSLMLSMGNFNGDAVTAAANAGKALAEMQQAMQGSGGIFQLFTGEKDMGQFGEQLKAFGSAIVEFSKVVGADGAINADAIQNAANAGKIMSELQKGLAQNGEGFSISKLFAGEQNLTNFGEQLKAFGTAIVEFSSTVSAEGAIDQTAVQNAANAGQIMAELQKSLGTNTTSVFSLFAGEQNLEYFGTQLSKFGEGIVGFSNAITDNGGIDTEAIASAQSAGVAMAELANSLPNYGFGSDKLDLTGFGNDLNDYAASISQMSATLANVDLSKINQATGIAQTVATVITSLQGIDESVINKFWVLDSLATSLSNFSSKIVSVDLEKISAAVTAANRIAQLIRGLSSITGESVSGFAAAVSSLGQITYNDIAASFSNIDFSSIGTNITNQIATGFQSGASMVRERVRAAMVSISDSINDSRSDFTTAGNDLSDATAEGIQNGAANVSEEVASMMSDAAKGLDGYKTAFFNAGSNLAFGFANGIKTSAYAARTAASAMASAAVEAARKALDEHSPSKVMQKIGEYAGEGFIIGVDNCLDPASKIGTALSDSVIQGASVLLNVYSGFGDLDSVFNELVNLSEKLDTSTKEANDSTEETTENTSKLSEALKTVSDNVKSLIDRRNDLKAFNDILSKAGSNLSEGFISELLSSDGTYAGALSEMVNLTSDQLKKLSDVYDDQNLANKMEDTVQALSDELESLSSSKNRIKSVQTIFKRLGSTLSTSFQKELINVNGSFSNSLEGLSEMSDEFIKKLDEAFSENELISQTEDFISILSDDDGLAGAFDYAGSSFDGFVEKVVEAGDDISDVTSQIQKFADSVSDGFSKMDIKDQTGVSEFTDNLENNIIIAREWSENIETVFNKLGSYPSAWTEAFKKEVLEGGIDKYGKIISEMSSMNSEAIMDVVKSWNTANIYGSYLGTSVAESMYDSSKQLSTAMSDVGTNITQGVANGITNGTGAVKGSIDLLCQNIENTTRDYFGIHSPSTLMFKIGEYLVQGLVNGVTSASTALNESFTMINKAIELLERLGEEGLEIKVKITPVIDTADLNAKLSALKSASVSINSSNLIGKIDSVNGILGQNGVGNNASKLTEAVNKLTDKVDSIDPDKFGVKYEQNNYSPKALSTATIYRQTKNQISLARSKNGKSFTQ